MKYLSGRYLSDDASGGSGAGSSTGDDGKGKDGYVSKEEYTKLQGQLGSFIDTVSSYIDEQTKNAHNKGGKVEDKDPAPKFSMNDDDIEDLGFEKKQVEFINKLVSSVAEKTAKTVVESNLQSYDVGKTKRQLANEYDARTNDEFPDMLNKQSALYREADRIARNMLAVEPKANEQRPDFTYSATLQAAANLGISPKKKVVQNNDNPEPRQRQTKFQLETSSYSNGVRVDKKTENLSENRQFFRKAFGGK